MQAMISFPVQTVRRGWALWAARGLAATQAYEALTPGEQKRWEAYCEAAPQLRREQRELDALRRVVHLPAEELPYDLSATLRARLDEEQPALHRQGRIGAWAAATTAAALLAVGFYIGVMGFNDSTISLYPTDERADNGLLSQGLSDPFAAVYAQARKLKDEGNEAAAAEALHAYCQTHPEDDVPAEVLSFLADLEFCHLQRYQQAYELYDSLRSRHPDAFAANFDGNRRLGLLAEARRENFEPLHALDRARSYPNNSFVLFERLIAQYPNTLLADAAMEDLRALVNDGDMGVIESFERALENCSDPIAKSQLNLALGRVCQARDDRECARLNYLQAAASDHIALATQAQQALMSLE